MAESNSGAVLLVRCQIEGIAASRLRESTRLQETLDFRVKSVQAWGGKTFRSTGARMLKRKPLFLNGLPAGDAATWEEVAVIVSAILGRPVSVLEVQANGSEGRESFLVTLAK